MFENVCSICVCTLHVRVRMNVGGWHVLDTACSISNFPLCRVMIFVDTILLVMCGLCKGDTQHIYNNNMEREELINRAIHVLVTMVRIRKNGECISISHGHP